LPKRVEAAAKAGYRGFTFSDKDLANIRRDPQWSDYKNIARLLASNGFEFTELEGLHDWFSDGERGRQADEVAHQLAEAAEALGSHHIKASGDLQHVYPVEGMAERFAWLCDLAARAGTRIALEPTPLSNLATPEQGLDLIKKAGVKNAGLMLDLWHIGRAGVPYESIAQIPVSLISGVELEDADFEVRGTLWDDTMNHRKLCGEGDLDPPRFLAAVLRTGYSGMYGTEMVSEEHRARPLDVAARVAVDALNRQFPLAAALLQQSTHSED